MNRLRGLGLELRSWLRRRVTVQPRARRLHAANPVKLMPAQARVVAHLKSHAWAAIPSRELFGDDPLLCSLSDSLRSFAKGSEVERRAQGLGGRTSLASRKPYVISYADERGSFRTTDPIFEFGRQEVLIDIANAYLGQWTKFYQMDVWVNLPVEPGTLRTASQNWHRDPEEERFLKVLFYPDDVDDDSGPMEFVPESLPGGRYAHLCHLPSGAHRLAYPEQARIEDQVPECDRVRFVGRGGSLVFLDPTGLHRGGYSLSKTRIMAIWSYIPASSLFSPTYRLADPPRMEGLSRRVRYALEGVPADAPRAAG